jgi:hypothetical protein
VYGSGEPDAVCTDAAAVAAESAGLDMTANGLEQQARRFRALVGFWKRDEGAIEISPGRTDETRVRIILVGWSGYRREISYGPTLAVAMDRLAERIGE